MFRFFFQPSPAMSCCSTDMLDSSATAGYEDIKKMLRETKDRMISVRAGMPYEDHVKATEVHILSVFLNIFLSNNSMFLIYHTWNIYYTVNL